MYDSSDGNIHLNFHSLCKQYACINMTVISNEMYCINEEQAVFRNRLGMSTEWNHTLKLWTESRVVHFSSINLLSSRWPAKVNINTTKSSIWLIQQSGECMWTGVILEFSRAKKKLKILISLHFWTNEELSHVQDFCCISVYLEDIIGLKFGLLKWYKIVLTCKLLPYTYVCSINQPIIAYVNFTISFNSKIDNRISTEFYL